MNEESENLSMIDCGIESLNDIPFKLSLKSINFHSNSIKKIENLNFLQYLMHLDLSSNKIKAMCGLDALVSLKTLNLSCNFLTSIENLENLKNLVWLNLSYNKIKSVTGLNELWGTEYALETLLLHGNFICSVEDTLYYMSGLKSLRHLTLYGNKFVKITNYRPLLFHNIKHLTSLDGKDKADKAVSYDLKSLSLITLLDEYEDFISWKSPEEKINSKNFRQDISKRIQPIKDKLNLSTTTNTKKEKTKVPATSTLDKRSKLHLIEDKIHELLLVRNTIKHKKNTSKRNSDGSSEDESESSISSDDSFYSTASLSKIECKKKKPFKLDKETKAKPLTSQVNLNNLKENKPVSILKTNSQSDTNINIKGVAMCDKTTASTSSKGLNDLIEYLQSQLNNYKESQEANTKLICELKANLESCNSNKQEILSKKDEAINNLNKEIEALKGKNDEMSKKLCQYECDSKKYKNKDEIFKEHLLNVKNQLKLFYQAELDKQEKLHEQAMQHDKDKIESLEKSYKSLEDEFRSALIIESNRYNDLFVKYEKVNVEYLDMKMKLKEADQNDQRSKALILELNELIKEQKTRLQTLSKLRKETTEDIHKRNEKLSEAVNDCVKLKAQLETLKKEKRELEINFKKFLLDYNDIKKEKESWNKKMGEQKALLMQENGRYEVENHAMAAELENLKKNYEKELDTVKIKSKIVEDQTETIKKLKSAVLERDDLLKKSREESLNTQKSLEKQLNDEMDLSNELQVKLNKSNERKESLKIELENLKVNLTDTKLAYEELSNKWTQKSELITELDTKVRKMKESYEMKEAKVLDDLREAEEINKQLNERLRKVDDDFRYQYDIEKKEHLKLVEKLKKEHNEKLLKSEEKIKEIENEMREILIESENKKKMYEDKIKSFSALFTKMQQDFQM